MHRNSPPISVLNAEVSTVAVEINTLTIGRKQVTLAVFRQLQDEDLINLKTNTFNGLPWGTVNYHPDAKCDPDRQPRGGWCPEHLHVVWQKGSELRRARVSPGMGGHISGAYPDTLQRSIQETGKAITKLADVLERVEKTIDSTQTLQSRWQARHETEVCTALGLPKTSWSPTCCSCCYAEHERPDNYQPRDTNCPPVDVTPEMVRAVRQEFHRKATKLITEKSRLNTCRVQAENAVAASEKAYDARYAELQALPQLFIAV